MKKILGLASALSFLLISCNHKVENKSTPLANTLAKSAETKAVEINPKEAPFEIYRLMAKDPKNVNLSPLSLKMAFGLIYPGAGESAKLTLEQLFGFKSGQYQSFAEDFKVMEQFAKEKGTNELYLANSLWAKEPKRILPEFQNAVKKMGASIEPLNLKQINEWVSEGTRGKITRILDKLDPSISLIALNAIYFKAQWLTPFKKEATILAHFQSSPYGTTTTPMMKMKHHFRYMEDEVSQWIELPYLNSPFVLLAALPKKRFELNALEQKLSNDYVKGIEAKMKDETVDLVLPKFKFDEKASLKSLMSHAGFGGLFEKGVFTQIAKSSDFRISDVIQATALEVNEQGTEAAAATAIAMEKSSFSMGLTKKFYADQPFIFMLKNTKSNEIYFLGRLYQP